MIDETILKDFGVIWPRHVSSLTQFLIECRRHFDGDLDLFLVLCIIGDRTFSARHVPPGMDFENWKSAEVDRRPVRGHQRPVHFGLQQHPA